MTKRQMRRRIGRKSKNRLASENLRLASNVVPSRPLDVHRWSDYPELNNCLTQLVAKIERSEQRIRKRSTLAAKRFRDAVRCLVLDLYVAWSADPDSVVGVALGKDSFQRGTRYDALFLTYDAFHPAYSGLVELGYVQEVLPGFHDPRTGIGCVTRVRATSKLIELLIGPSKLNFAKLNHRSDTYAQEVIILRDEEKSDIEYRNTKLTNQMRSDLMRINDALASNWIDLYVTDKEIAALNTRMANDNRRDSQSPPYIDFAARRLRRIFNNSVWTEGGRFYGGWWQTVPSEYRAHITINGKPVVEIDYSGMHPTLLYAAAGVKPDAGVDVYDIGKPNVPRHIVKIAFNKLVNASNGTRETPDFDEEQMGVSWSQLVKLIRLRHEPIAQFLGTGYGLHLQNKDAKIANRIMLRFLSSGYVCLPVHDSFIVHHAFRDELKQIMCEEFSAEVGTDIEAKTKFDVIDAGVRYEDDGTDMANPLSGLTGKYEVVPVSETGA